MSITDDGFRLAAAGTSSDNTCWVLEPAAPTDVAARMVELVPVGKSATVFPYDAKGKTPGAVVLRTADGWVVRSAQDPYPKWCRQFQLLLRDNEEITNAHSTDA